MEVRLSRRAEQDLEDILFYTTESWGLERSLQYQDDLVRAMRRLAEFPHLGRPTQGLHSGTRSLTVNQHLMIYRVSSEAITIARILHVRRGPDLDIDE